jgi:hypothetical protein
MKKGAFYFRSRKHIGFKKTGPAFRYISVIRRSEHKMPLQSGLGERFV